MKKILATVGVCLALCACSSDEPKDIYSISSAEFHSTVEGTLWTLDAEKRQVVLRDGTIKKYFPIIGQDAYSSNALMFANSVCTRFFVRGLFESPAEPRAQGEWEYSFDQKTGNISFVPGQNGQLPDFIVKSATPVELVMLRPWPYKYWAEQEDADNGKDIEYLVEYYRPATEAETADYLTWPEY